MKILNKIWRFFFPKNFKEEIKKGIGIGVKRAEKAKKKVIKNG